VWTGPKIVIEALLGLGVATKKKTWGNSGKVVQFRRITADFAILINSEWTNVYLYIVLLFINISWTLMGLPNVNKFNFIVKSYQNVQWTFTEMGIQH